MEIPEIQNIKTFDKDGRKSIHEIYDSYGGLDERLWNCEIIYSQEFFMNGRKYSIPILGFKTKRKGPALWLIAGIHGEEPAGPNVFADSIKFLNNLAKKIPIVLLPMCNPSGYTRDWRYPNERRIRRSGVGRSVGDAEHYLLDLKNSLRARLSKPSSEDAKKLTSFVLKNIKKYPPVLVLDFHEDESSTSFYIYSHGKLGAQDPVAEEIVSVLLREGFKLRMKGKTTFGEKITNGIVFGVADGSIDELLSAKKIIVNGKIKRKFRAKSTIVVETSTKNFPLLKRMLVHREILLSSERFFEFAENI